MPSDHALTLPTIVSMWMNLYFVLRHLPVMPARRAVALIPALASAYGFRGFFCLYIPLVEGRAKMA
jgi:hypothetical protein